MRRKYQTDRERNEVLMKLSDILVSSRFKENLGGQAMQHLEEMFMLYRTKRQADELDEALAVAEKIIKQYSSGHV